MQKSEELESQPQIEQPGLSRLREAVANARQQLPGPTTLVQDGLAGVAMLMVLSQFPTVTGVEATGSNKLTQALSVIANIGESDWLTLGTALLALLLIIVLPRTPLGNLGPLVAIFIPSVLVGLLGWDSVQTVRDVGEIVRGFPKMSLPSFSDLSPGMITGALAVALIVIVQGAGVSQSVPNPNGARRSTSRDMIAQGAANLAAGLFRGVPVGGSLSSTALSVIGGSSTRWAAILSGVWMALIVLLFPGLIAYVAMPALGALLIHAGLGTIKPQEWLEIWEVGWPSRLASISTLLATLTLPIEAAVGIGVVLSAMLYLYQSSGDLSVVELVEHPDGSIEERKRPHQLKDNHITVLDIYGPVFYASARTLGRLLPAPEGARKRNERTGVPTAAKLRQAQPRELCTDLRCHSDPWPVHAGGDCSCPRMACQPE